MKHIVTFLLLLSSVSQVSIAAQQSKVKILTLDWTSQIVLSYITGQLIEKQGIEVEYISRPARGQWYLMTTNQADIQIEIWTGTLGNKFNSLVAGGKIINAGKHLSKGREDWWYPLYVKALCPGLPDWRALNRCSKLFATSETSPQGRYIAGPWLKRESARIRALKLDFKMVVYNTSDQILEKLNLAAKHHQPILLYNWSPNWTDLHIPGEFVEFPIYNPLCETLPNWGLNKKWLWDCGNPKSGDIHKVTSPALPQLSPCAFAIVEAIIFTAQDIIEVSYWRDIDGLTYQDAANKWLKKNTARWQVWLNQPEQCPRSNLVTID